MGQRPTSRFGLVADKIDPNQYQWEEENARYEQDADQSLAQSWR